jgi:hypothetical protein
MTAAEAQQEEDTSAGVRLLADLREVFGAAEGGCPDRRGTSVAVRGDQAAASSLVGVTAAMVWSSATWSAGRCR